ncbi:MAG: histidine kinase [Bryobacteraceae bacterium]|nr:histidine kinase [Bryobacteraceae bacterium]
MIHSVSASLDTLTVHEPLLVNTIGHSVGALIFGIFIYLLLRDRAGARLRSSRLSLIAALFAFSWHFSSLAVIAVLAREGNPNSFLVFLSASALSLLPAVLLHLSPAGRHRYIVVAGYLLSILAVAVHGSELLISRPQSHRLALTLITIGFGVLTVLSAIHLIARSGRSDRKQVLSRVLGTMSLFLFAMSFVHFDARTFDHPWPLELLLHHASIPLALFVLLQDYRFVLLDAFLRFLANILLAALLTFGAIRTAKVLGDSVAGDPFSEGMLMVGACMTFVLFAVLRTRLQAALTRIIFQRPDLEKVLEGLRIDAAATKDEAAYLKAAESRVARFIDAEIVPASDISGSLLALDLHFPLLSADLPAHCRDLLAERGIEAVVPLRPSYGDSRFLLLGRRQGGRRYLSEDLQALARLSREIVDQTERFRESELRRLVTQAELRALQSQIHPHFLFNALNTLYGVIPRNATGARRTVLNLADIFRYFLQTDRSYIALEEELKIVKAYLEIEALRLGPKLRTEINVAEEALRTPIPVLSVEPLVENAVKHGVATQAEGGFVRVEAYHEPEGLRIRVVDSGKGFTDEKRGVGLENVRRRLRLCYGPEGRLDIQSSPEGTSVGFLVPASKSVEVAL